MRGRLKKYGRKKKSSFMEYLMNSYGYVNSGTAGGQTAYQNYTNASYQPSIIYRPPINYEYVWKSEKQPVEITKCGFIIRCFDNITIKDHYGQMLFQIDKDGLYKYRFIKDHDTNDQGMLFIFNEDAL
jgi:hypothetical protein